MTTKTTINIKNLDRLIKHLKLISNANFEMSFWTLGGGKWLGKPAEQLVSYMETGVGDCGTVACIAGHAAILKQVETQQMFRRGREWSDANEWLGLSESISSQLFTPKVDYDRITPKEAVKVLEHLKKTALEGNPEVVWSVADVIGVTVEKTYE